MFSGGSAEILSIIEGCRDLLKFESGIKGLGIGLSCYSFDGFETVKEVAKSQIVPKDLMLGSLETGYFPCC